MYIQRHSQFGMEITLVLSNTIPTIPTLPSKEAIAEGTLNYSHEIARWRVSYQGSGWWIAGSKYS